MKTFNLLAGNNKLALFLIEMSHALYVNGVK